MARKDTLRTQILSAQSLAATFTSPITMIRNLDNCAYQINITTSNSTGTFSVQVSDDYSPDAPASAPANTGNWVDLTLGGGTPTVAAANDTIMINLNQLPFNAMRIKYTAGTAGTGHCDVWLVCKQVGG